ncbi:MAG: hypothetical protein V3V14_07735 [Saprospiraceae bacterium]
MVNTEKKYHPIITHDIDRYYKWNSYKSLLGEWSRITQGQSSWTYAEAWYSYKKRTTKDPFSNICEIVNMDKKYGLDSVTYIMTTDQIHPININDYRVEDLKNDLEHILSMDGEIGIHPGIFTYNDFEKFNSQKNALETISKQKIIRNRQHYLKYDPSITFHNLAKSGIKNDSSILVDNMEMPPYDTYTMLDNNNNEIGITQTPLVFMDTHHMNKSDNTILAILEQALAPAKANNGEVMVLWHNNNVSNDRERGLYREVLQVMKG